MPSVTRARGVKAKAQNAAERSPQQGRGNNSPQIAKKTHAKEPAVSKRSQRSSFAEGNDGPRNGQSASAMVGMSLVGASISPLFAPVLSNGGGTFQTVFAPEKDAGAGGKSEEEATPTKPKKRRVGGAGRPKGSRNKQKDIPQNLSNEARVAFPLDVGAISTNELGDLDTTEATRQSPEISQNQESYAGSSAAKTIEARRLKLKKNSIEDPAGYSAENNSYRSIEELDEDYAFLMKLMKTTGLMSEDSEDVDLDPGPLTPLYNELRNKSDNTEPTEEKNAD